MKLFFGAFALLTSLAHASFGPAAPVRIFVAGHSFHVGIADALPSIVAADRETPEPRIQKVFAANSRSIEIWNQDPNPVKAALAAAEVDVLTLSPNRAVPDEGIDNFVAFGLARNNAMRFTVQLSWLPFDDLPAGEPHDRNAMTEPELLAIHAAYFETLHRQIATINEKYGHRVVAGVPIGAAVIRLRELVRRGEVPGIAREDDLFRDTMNHPGIALTVLNGYCHYAVIYGKSPVGLPVPDALLHSVWFFEIAKLNRLLQEVAWDAVTHDPASGVPPAP